MQKRKKSRIGKTLLNKSKKVGSLALLDIKTYYETIVIKTKVDNRSMEMKENPKTKHTHIQTKGSTSEIQGSKTHASK